MRIVFFAKAHSRTGNTRHLIRGLEQAGHTVLHVNRRRAERLAGERLAWWWIARRVRTFAPDLVFVYSFDLPPERLLEYRAAGVRTAVFFDDCPHELDERLARQARAADVFCITNRGQIPLYQQQLGVTPIHVAGGCDPVDHFRVPPEPRFACDVTYIGKADTRGERIPVLQALARRFDVRVHGPGPWREHGLQRGLPDVYPPQYRAICNSARVVIGCDLRADVDLYFSNRTWLSLGCGAFLATRYVPNLEETLTEGEHCVFFRSPEDAVEVVGRYLADDPARARIAAAGHAFAHERYTYRHMMERMLAHPAFGSPAPAPAPAAGP